ncbi:MAG: hypothetical protein GY937_23065, partial [bacterium]|nr:hypothetical protein [bacterium]
MARTERATRRIETEAERSALIQDVIREMGERLATPVGERQVTPKGLPVIEPYEVAITYRG